MIQPPNPEMLTLAREVRGVTQTELAEKSGIDQGRISRYEGGIKSIPQDELNTLADVLSFPIEFFFREGKRRGAETVEIFHRKRRTSSAMQEKRLDGYLNLRRFEVADLLKAIAQIAQYSIPQYDLDEFGGDIEEIAATVRAAWGMPAGPVDNLIQQLEAATCMIFSHDFETDKIDEITQWIEPTPPIILINSRAPAERIRFSLAHALGHLVMHHNQIPYPKMEDEADQFASAFLMPSDDIRQELPPVTIDHMLQLKPYWKVSMQALVRRARDIGVITDRRYTSLFQTLSRVGYRKKEPFPIPAEKPEQVSSLRDYYRNQLNYTIAELAKLVRLSEEDFRVWYFSDTAHLTLLDKSKRSAG
jgi:Zn-dependent peptidase ImmA (M78 family)